VALTKITVEEVMQANPTTIAPDRPVREALDALLDSPHECLVVVDGGQHPVGIVTEGDILRRVLAEEVPGGAYLRAILVSPDSALDHLREEDRARGSTVADLMTSPVTMATPEQSLQETAQLFWVARFRQIPVVRDGVLVGLIRRRDLIEPIRRQHDEAEQTPPQARD
jgi:CBS domain-containing protein